MDIQFEPDWEEHLFSATDRMFEEKLGPAMEDQVKRNTPVDLDNLRQSVKFEVDRTNHTLAINAYGDEKREKDNRKYYAAWVDLGHRQFAWGRDTGKVRQPTAFMRQALYRRYEGF